jgi:hypothetical protein
MLQLENLDPIYFIFHFHPMKVYKGGVFFYKFTLKICVIWDEPIKEA